MAKLATFTDTFAGTTLNSSNWYIEPDSSNGQPSGTVTVSGGTCSLAGGNYSDTGYYTSVNSQDAYDLTSSYAFVRVIPGGSGAGDGDSGFAVLAGNFSDGYNYDVTGGLLLVESTVGDNPTTLHSAAYSATAMAWLRIREASGTLYFEYAATASGTYTTFYSTTTEAVGTWTAVSSYVQLFYGSNSGDSQPAGTAGFQDFNVAPAPPAPFAPASRARAARAARKGTSAGSPGAKYTFVPVIPAPFSPPHRPAAGRPAARRGAAQAGNAGAAYVYVPVVPSPFAPPHAAARGRQAARKGGAHGSPGAPWSVPPYVVLDTTGAAVLDTAGQFIEDTSAPVPATTAAPFAQPSRAVSARRAARRGAAAGLVPSAYSPFVQATSGSTTGTSLTLTFPRPVTLGDAVIVTVAGYYDGTVTGIALGTSGGSFAHLAGAGGTGGNNAGVYANLSAAQSAATLTITTSAAGIIAYAYEVSGTLCYETSAGETGSGTSWASGNTAETALYGHFTVGMGSVIANTGSITATGAGWVNGRSYTDVVGAAGHAIGAVSGYRLTSTPAELAYTGTAGTGSAWGAVAASFLILPGGSTTQPGWGGYVFYEHASYTGISATFTIPTVTGGEYDSIWVGLGNVYQVGIYQTYVSGDPGGSSTRPWTWWLPGAGEAWNQAAFPTAAGDQLTLAMQLTSTDWLMTISNNTEGWTYTEVRSVLSVNLGSINDDGAGNPVWPYPCGGAEVIIEKETTQLPAYGSVAFTSVTTTPPATVAPQMIFTVNGNVDQYPGPYNVANGSFTLYWNAYS